MGNLTSANNYVPKIDRILRVVKERCRGTRHSLLFMRLPVILDINIVLNNVNLLGYFPTTAGILKTISTIEIMIGETLNNKIHMAIPFGKYCQIHEEENPRNSTRPRTRGSICVGTSRNKQGGFNFMTLGSMKKLIRRIWYAIPMPVIVIARVNALV